MTYLLMSALLLPLTVVATCLESSDSCPSSSKALLQSSLSRQMGTDDATQGGLEQRVLMLQEGGARSHGGPSQGSSTPDQLLMQLQSRVEAAVQDGESLSPLENSLMEALKATLENTTLPALKKGHEDDQMEMNRTVQALANCNSNFVIDSEKAASAKRMLDAKKDLHRHCRGNQSKLKSTRNEKMKDLKSFTDNLQQPQKPVTLAPTAADSYFAAGLKWFRENQVLYIAKKSAYTTAKEDHDNKTDSCNIAQTSYESDYCQWVGQATAASKSYTRCWDQGGGNDWNQTRATVLDSAEQRKHEYVAVKKIQCFLSSLLSLFTKAGKVTKTNISACKALVPDVSIFDIVNTGAPSKKSLTSLGNLTSTPGDGVWQKSEYADLNDTEKPTPCAKALDENGTLIWKDGNATHLCNINQHVQVHRCQPCAPGKSRPEGDNAVGPDTDCSTIVCGTDEHVESNRCTACLAGKTRIAGDDASKADTSCTATLCAANQRVSSHRCDNCPAGRTNAADDDASGGNTSCDAILCTENQHVQAHACHSCSAGKTNSAGDDASAGNTSCKAIRCLRNQHVKSNTCHTCAAGKTNAAGDDASGSDTQCTATKCAANKKVVSSECKGCPAGKTNAEGDDASGSDSTCDAIKCAANQYVKAHACKACPDGTTNAAGDDASGRDTKCDAIVCGANQRVVSHGCVSCPVNTKNTAGDDASGSNTQCDATCALYSCPSGYAKKNHGSTTYSQINCCQIISQVWIERPLVAAEGNGVSGSILPLTTVGACKQTCDSNTNCHSFAVCRNPGYGHPPGCWMKDKQVTASEATSSSTGSLNTRRCTTWYKAEFTYIHSYSNRRCSNYKVGGRWTRVYKSATSVAECGQICISAAQDEGVSCNAFAYRGGQCWFNPTSSGCKIEYWGGWSVYKPKQVA